MGRNAATDIISGPALRNTSALQHLNLRLSSVPLPPSSLILEDLMTHSFRESIAIELRWRSRNSCGTLHAALHQAWQQLTFGVLTSNIDFECTFDSLHECKLLEYIHNAQKVHSWTFHLSCRDTPVAVREQLLWSGTIGFVLSTAVHEQIPPSMNTE